MVSTTPKDNWRNGSVALFRCPVCARVVLTSWGRARHGDGPRGAMDGAAWVGGFEEIYIVVQPPGIRPGGNSVLGGSPEHSQRTFERQVHVRYIRLWLHVCITNKNKRSFEF